MIPINPAINSATNLNTNQLPISKKLKTGAPSEDSSIDIGNTSKRESRGETNKKDIHERSGKWSQSESQA